jgi:3-oxoacyl-[acyl-carrier protein] reductase
MTSDNVIWITGASSGIGKAVAKEFARIGCKVFASARRVTELERLNSELAAENLSVEILPLNVASHQNVEQAAKKVLTEGKLDCLINIAGITSFKSAEANSVNEIVDIINTNLLGSIYTIKSVLPKMIEKREGVIVNLLSVVSQKVFTKSSAYSASKSGLKAYTDVLREEVRKHNIKVINITPGATETPIWSQEIRKQYGERMMTPDDIAKVIVWAFLQKGNLVTEEIVLRPVQGDL